jgi:hypothetical protein
VKPVTATRTGDVEPAVTVLDPAKQAPLTPSAGAGFRGRYNKMLTGSDGQRASDVELTVTTNCIRNTDHCLTYSVSGGAGGAARAVRA